MDFLMLVCAGGSALCLAWGTNWLALSSWRGAQTLHWTERARRFYPVRAAAASNLWVLPALLTGIVICDWPEAHPHWGLLLLVTALGTTLGTLPMDHEVFARIPMRALLRQAAITWALRFLVWSVFLTAVAVMPGRFNSEAWVILAGVLAFFIFWTRDGWIWIGGKLGLFVPASDRLQRIVEGTASRMKVQFREACQMCIWLAQAYALPASRRLLFSERLLELLSDEEIAAVCAHELAHLTESYIQRYSRYMIWLMFLPWVLFNPIVNTIGMPGFLALVVWSALVPWVYRTISHQLEKRADRLALAYEPDSGSYARALAKLYEDALLPAVNPKKRASHPHLYDRLIAAGVTPEFPRPPAPASIAWHGVVLSIALGVVAVILVGRMVGT